MGLEKIMGYVGLDGSGFEVGAKRVESAAAKLGGNIEHHLKGAIVGAFGVAAIEEATRRTIEFGAQIEDVSKRLGMTAEKFQELRFAFTSTGGSEGGMISFLEKLSTAREKALGGNAAMQGNFSRLGVSSSDLGSKSNSDLMGIIGKSIAEGNIQNLIAPLRAVGGKGAGELVAGFKAGIEEKAAELRAKGGVMSDASASAMKQLEEQSKNFATMLMATLAPAIIWVMDRFYDMVGMFKIVGAFLGGLTSKITVGNIAKELKDPKNLLYGPAAPAVILGKLMAGGASDAVTAADKALDEENKKRIQRDIDRQKPTPTPETFTGPKKLKDVKDEKEKTINKNERAIPIDSLQKIGGFVGVGAEMPMVNLAKEQLQQLKVIAQNTKPDNSDGGDSESIVDGD